MSAHVLTECARTRRAARWLVGAGLLAGLALLTAGCPNVPLPPREGWVFPVYKPSYLTSSEEAPDGAFFVSGHQHDRQMFAARLSPQGTLERVVEITDLYRPQSPPVRASLVARDGSYYVAGTTDVYFEPQRRVVRTRIVKMTPQLEVLWDYNYDTPHTWHPHDIREAPDGGIIMGATVLSGNTYGVIARFSPEGENKWAWLPTDAPARLFRPTGLHVAEDGAIAAAGSLDRQELSFVRLDAEGNLLMLLRYGGIVGRRVVDLVPASDGGFYIAGVTSGAFGLFITRLDDAGELLWDQPDAYPLPDAEWRHETDWRVEVARMVVDANDNLFIIGAEREAGLFLFPYLGEKWSPFLACYDANGAMKWKRYFGRDLRSLSWTHDGMLLIGSYTGNYCVLTLHDPKDGALLN